MDSRPTCRQSPGPGCLYFPPTRYAFTEIERETVYDDAAGQPRTVRVLLRKTRGRGPAPAGGRNGVFQVFLTSWSTGR
jgi:hypothetical protein